MDKYKLTYKDFIRRYKVIRREKSASTGEYILMKDMKTRKNVLVKCHEVQPNQQENQHDQTMVSNQYSDYQQYQLIKDQQIYNIEKDENIQATIQKAIQLNRSQNIIKFLGYATASPPQCDLNQLLIIYELSDQNLTLEQHITKLVQKKDEFEEKFLWTLLDNMCEVLGFMEQKGISHGDIHPRNISLFKGDLYPKFKIFYSSYTISSYEQVAQFQENYLNYFLSPEQMDGLNNGQQEEMYNKFSSDYFSLGALILHLGAIQISNKLYKVSDLSYNPESLERKLIYFKQIYSKQLSGLVEKMIRIDPAERHSFIQIKNLIKQIRSKGFVSPPKSRIEENKKKPKNVLSPLRNPNTKSQIVFTNNTQQSPYNSQIASIKQSQINPQPVPYQYNQSSGHPISGSTRHTSSNKVLLKFNPPEFDQSQISIDPRSSQYDKLHENLRQELHQNRERRQLSQDRWRSPSQYSQRSQKSYHMSPSQQSIRGSMYFPRGGSPGKRQSSSPMRQSNITSVSQQQQTKRKKRVQQSPQSLHRMHTVELEKDLIYDAQGNLKEGMGKKHYVDGSVYIGQTSNDQREGIGIYYYRSGEVYAGEWKHNMLYGKGRYVFSNGEKYEGEIVDGKKQGQGTYKYYNGNVYAGEWMDDKKHGFGNYKYDEKGEEYSGEFVQGLREGQGTYLFANGDQFTGTWLQGQKHGHGTVSFANGCQFSGEWNQDLANGQGKLMYANGDVYEGQYLCGIKEGDGIYVQSTSNSKYQGSWEKDQPCGHGQFHFANGDVYEGEVVQGLRFGSGIYKYENGDVFRGEWKNDQKNGQGVIQYADGTEYTGNWLNNYKSGQGKIIYDNLDTYEGDWLKDQKQGKGVYTWAKGGQYTGMWYKDRMNGFGEYLSDRNEVTEGYWADNQYVEEED